MYVFACICTCMYTHTRITRLWLHSLLLHVCVHVYKHDTKSIFSDGTHTHRVYTCFEKHASIYLHFICAYACIHVYIYTCMYMVYSVVGTHAFRSISSSRARNQVKHTRTYFHLCMCMYIYLYVINIQVSIHILYVHVHVHMFIYIYIYIYEYMYMVYVVM